MKHYAGLDVSVKETSVCIVDETGTICREIKVVSHPEDLLRVLQDTAWHLERIRSRGRAALAMALRGDRLSRAPCRVHRDAAHQSLS